MMKRGCDLGVELTAGTGLDDHIGLLDACGRPDSSRFDMSASNTSATAMILASSGISLPLRPAG
jgi:hypothetical protein